ncbi:hypothetical protein WJX73_005544 [Symbiochloris irregularis]|uniref:Uncharacterized protein n=1 Tax=Symbiochloris irregularis TaxID=706552 RepID=A0AAW1PWZ5_9CHLO
MKWAATVNPQVPDCGGPQGICAEARGELGSACPGRLRGRALGDGTHFHLHHPISFGAASNCTEPGLPGFIMRLPASTLFLGGPREVLAQVTDKHVDIALFDLRCSVFDALGMDPGAEPAAAAVAEKDVHSAQEDWASWRTQLAVSQPAACGDAVKAPPL